MAEFFEGSSEDETQNFLDQLGALTPEQREQMTNEFSSFVESWVRWRYLPRAKQFIRDRVLSNGSPVTTSSAGTTLDLKNTSIFDTFNFIGATVNINSSNARQVDITANGGGADCMFDTITSTCFTSLPNWVEGTAFTSLSGCTFYGYSTWQGALNKLAALTGPRSMYVCHGNYVEDVSLSSISGDYTIVGAGVGVVTLTAATTNGDTFNVGSSHNFSIRDVTIIGNGSGVAFRHANGGLCNIDNIEVKPQSGGVGFQYSGGEMVRSMRITGTSAQVAVQNASNPAFPAIFNDIWISGCQYGFAMLTTSRIEVRSAYIASASIAGLLLGANQGADRSIFTGIIFDTCATGVAFQSEAMDDTLCTDNIFYNCTKGIDFSGLSIAGILKGSNGSNFTNNTFFTTTSSNFGMVANGGSAALKNAIIALNNFRGYTAGNEITGTSSFGTGTQVFHNITDSGTALTDFGSPVGHAGTGGGTGGAAANDRTFLTVTDEHVALPNSRRLLGDTGITLTDAGAGSTDTLHSLREIVFIMDGGGSTLATGVRPPVQVPFNCTVNSWNLCGDAAGTCTVDITTATDAATPSFSSIVGAGTKPNVAGPAVCSTATAPASWTTTAITAGQLLQPNLTAVTAFKTLMLALKVTTT